MSPRVAAFGLVLVIFLLVGPQRSAGSSCVCYGTCPELDESKCAYGVGMDKCFCCKVCLQGPGEICGGHFDMSGRCGTGLRCWRGHRAAYHEEGICAFEDAIEFPDFTH